MINESQAKQYCREDITHIKNYAEAVADKTRTWLCHHINGEPFTGFCRKDLIKMNMYEQRPASELMFVTRKMHEDIHGSCKTAGKSNKGRTPSKETRQKLSDAKKGKHPSEESRKKMSVSMKGRTLSEEHRQKLSIANKGKRLSEDTRQKMSIAHKGKTHSEEHRQKLSESNKGKRRSVETRQKITEANKGKMLDKHWFNNGEINKRALVCPEGFVKGRLRGKKI